MNETRARELLAGERRRIESLLAELRGDIRSYGSLERQQTGDSGDAANALDAESVSVALEAGLVEELAAVGRAEERIHNGTYGKSVDSGIAIPDDRLEVEPLAERTVEEQRAFESKAARS